MGSYRKQMETRWSDMDPNFHLRHSVYYDFGAFVRLAFLHDNGLMPNVMQEHHFGPIIFREECVFRKEIRFGDLVHLDIQLIKSKRDYSRWTICHHVFKNEDTLAAILTIDGAWMDTAIRKLTIPPDIARTCFDLMPKGESLVWED
jgi:acyl-CoA thioester hydrolase